MTSRDVLLVTHTGRTAAIEAARRLITELAKVGFAVRVLTTELTDLDVSPEPAAVDGIEAAAGVELIVALGGDGTLLRAAELARPTGVPLLGINLGRVGFLAEAEADHLDDVVRQITAREYEVDERLTAHVEVYDAGQLIARDWALNEITVERTARARMIELLINIDGEPISRWGCDGVICATPTGSTAYAFSAGGPVVWPAVAALLVIPLSAHALFNRPLVVAPTSTITIEVHEGSAATVVCDGRRCYDITEHGRLIFAASDRPVRVVRLRRRTFTDRLVAKFGLDVNGWRQ